MCRRPASFYRLQAVLDLRTRQRDGRRVELARAVAREQEAHARHVRAEQVYRAQLEQLHSERQQTPTGGHARDYLAAQRFIDTVAARLKECEVEVQRSADLQAKQQAALAGAMEAVRAAEAAVRAVQTHKDLWRQARDRDRARQAAEELDDIGRSLAKRREDLQGSDNGISPAIGEQRDESC